jgi:hypothetical protein
MVVVGSKNQETITIPTYLLNQFLQLSGKELSITLQIVDEVGENKSPNLKQSKPPKVDSVEEVKNANSNMSKPPKIARNASTTMKKIITTIGSQEEPSKMCVGIRSSSKI